MLKASLAKFDLATAQGEKDEYAKESFKDVDDIIDELNRRGLLVRQGGGPITGCTTRSGRRFTSHSKEVLRENPGDGPAWSTPISNLHDSIFNYYYKYVYLQSQDIPSLFEYLYHRIASIRPAKLEDWPVRLQQLAATIQRERRSLALGPRPVPDLQPADAAPGAAGRRHRGRRREQGGEEGPRGGRPNSS